MGSMQDEDKEIRASHALYKKLKENNFSLLNLQGEEEDLFQDEEQVVNNIYRLLEQTSMNVRTSQLSMEISDEEKEEEVQSSASGNAKLQALQAENSALKLQLAQKNRRINANQTSEETRRSGKTN